MASITNNYSKFPDELYQLTKFEDVDDSLKAIIQRIEANMKLGNYSQVQIDLEEYREHLNPYILDDKFLNKFEEELRNVELYSGTKQQGIHFGDTEPIHVDNDVSWWHMDETSRIALAVPTVYSTLVFNGEEQSASVNSYNERLISVTGLTGIEAGTYYARATLLDPERYIWKDGSSGDQLIPWSIIKAPGGITVSSTNVQLNYNTTEIVVTIEGATGEVDNLSASNTNIDFVYDEDAGTITITNPRQIEGSTSITIDVEEVDNYKSSSTTIYVTSTYSTDVAIPGIYSNLIYNGSEQTASVDYYDQSLISVTGITGTLAKSYTASISLKDPYHYQWEDGTTETKYVTWTIQKQMIDVPAVYGGFIYNGSTQTATVSSYDSDIISITGLTGKNAGTYTAVVSLLDSDNCMWRDKTSSDKQIPWVIQKAPGAITLSALSVELNKDNESQRVNATNATGEVNAYSNDEELVTAGYTNQVITIAANSHSTGHTTVLVVVESTDNYERYTTTINVDCDYPVATNIYGIKFPIGYTRSNQRTDDAKDLGNAVGVNPSAIIPSTSTTTGSSPFDTIEPWASMRRVENSKAGSLIEIPKYYYKWTVDEEEKYYQLQISPEWQAGFLISPAHADRGDGVGERERVYIGRYKCVENTYKSKTGELPQVSKTRAEFRSSIHNLGSSIWQWDNAMLWTVLMLIIVETGSWGYGKAGMGQGCSDSNALENTGLTDSLSYHTGTTTASVNEYGHVQYRGIEDLWANAREWIDGIYFADEKVYGINKPANFSDNSNGIYIGDRLTSGNSYYIASWNFPTVPKFEYSLIPASVNPTRTHNDNLYGMYNYASTGVTLATGQYYYKNVSWANLSNYIGNYPASGSYATVGSRLMLLPAIGEIVDDGGGDDPEPTPTPDVKIVTWADGTDAEIKAMLDAHYAGQIDIHDYWSVGDMRQISLNAIAEVKDSTGNVVYHVAQPAQTQFLVLLNSGGITLTQPINGKTECAFVVGQLMTLTNDDRYYETNTQTIDWLNNQYRTSISSNIIRSLFKQFVNIRYNSSKTQYTTNDYFSIAAFKQVFGDDYGSWYGDLWYANALELELEQFEYYSNAYKEAHGNLATRVKNYKRYWTRSISKAGSNIVCVVDVAGDPAQGTATGLSGGKSGIAPFGVI